MSFARSITRTSLAVVLASTTWLAAPVDAAHRARLGADLEKKLAQGDQAIDVIVHGSRNEVDALARRYNLTVRKYLKSGAVLSVTAGQLDALSHDDSVDHLSADAPVNSSSLTTDSIGADQVWNGVGSLKPLSGAGIGVALIDSGIDPRHAALANRVVFTRDFTGGDGSDAYGHGTHVGALIAGQTGQTADTADNKGVAPSARLINLRVLDSRGMGRASDVIDAIDWAIDNRTAYNIRIINLSLGAAVVQSYKDDPLCEAVERAVSAGMVVVAAAGNYGVTKDGNLVFGSVTSPGNDPAALTVGAIDMHATAKRSDDTVAKYSSKGPTLFDLALKPDLVAPGSRLVSAEAADSYLSTTYPERHVAGSGSNAYMALSGTSMAAGVASGAVALLLEEKPQLSPVEVKLALQVTSSMVNGEGFLTAGSGELNVSAALRFAKTPRVGLSPDEIAGETVTPSGVAFLQRTDPGASKSSAETIIWGEAGASGNTIVWGGSALRGNTIIWGSADTIIWGSTIVWGNAAGSAVHDSADTIIWGSADTIIWGSAETIVWGGTIEWGSAETIVWGGSTTFANTIIWGSHVDSSTIIWGATVSGNTIIWGSASPETIIWGSASPETIVWGGASPETIVWGGASLETIVWGGATLETIIWGS
jgi:serine protease AprX